MTMAVSGQGKRREQRENKQLGKKLTKTVLGKKCFKIKVHGVIALLFCLSGETFPFIVLHGQCPVPVVQWIERVSPKD